jgi:hypothetical protein
MYAFVIRCGIYEQEILRITCDAYFPSDVWMLIVSLVKVIRK